MNLGNVYSSHFFEALQNGDDSSALSMLRSGRVTIRSRVSYEGGVVLEPAPVIFPAVEFGRELVVRALIGLGADIDTFHTLCDVEIGLAVTPAGAAILAGCASNLALCHRLGACFSFVSRIPTIDKRPHLPESALGLALRFHRDPACLEYLLDSVYPARPVEVNFFESYSLSAAALDGGFAKAVYKVLETRGFNFKQLEEVWPDQETPNWGMSAAAVMLMTPQQSGDADFLRYIVKDLGVATTSQRLDTSKDFTNAVIPMPKREKPAAALVKYECAACDALGATKVCGGCKVTRYCSKECCRRDWKTGGHKKECQEIQSRAPLRTSGSAAPNRL